jgi:hypothetical protein
MSLIEDIPTTPALQTAARKLALLLRESDATRVGNTDKRVKWFKYKRTERWSKEFDSLLEEVKNQVCIKKRYTFAMSLMFKANGIKLVVEKNAGVTLRKRKPTEKRPQPTLERLDAGWATIPAGHIGFLVSLTSEDCAGAEILGHRNDKYQRVERRQCGSGSVLFECVSLRTEPVGIPYALALVPTWPLGEEERENAVN